MASTDIEYKASPPDSVVIAAPQPTIPVTATATTPIVVTPTKSDATERAAIETEKAAKATAEYSRKSFGLLVASLIFIIIVTGLSITYMIMFTNFRNNPPSTSTGTPTNARAATMGFFAGLWNAIINLGRPIPVAPVNTTATRNAITNGASNGRNAISNRINSRANVPARNQQLVNQQRARFLQQQARVNRVPTAANAGTNASTMSATVPATIAAPITASPDKIEAFKKVNESRDQLDKIVIDLDKIKADILKYQAALNIDRASPKPTINKNVINDVVSSLAVITTDIKAIYRDLDEVKNERDAIVEAIGTLNKDASNVKSMIDTYLADVKKINDSYNAVKVKVDRLHQVMLNMGQVPAFKIHNDLANAIKSRSEGTDVIVSKNAKALNLIKNNKPTPYMDSVFAKSDMDKIKATAHATVPVAA